MYLLIVEDEEILLRSIERMLLSKGYRISTAPGGEEALELLERSANEVDIVLSDFHMRGMDGLKLLEEIRRKHGSMPVILMTGSADKELLIKAIRNRCTGFIEKPFAPDELIDEIDRVSATR